MFKFRNKTSKEMNVIVEESINFLGKAAQRIQVIEIEGKDGNEIIPLGYTDFTGSLSLTLMKKDRLNDVLDWLNGEGLLEYKNKVTFASFYGSISPTRLSSKVSIKVDFTRNPFWYKKDDNYTTVSSEIVNEGNTEVFPYLMLKKTDHDYIELSINDVRLKYNFNDTNHVVIDCMEKNATEDGFLRNRNLEINYRFPKLNPGSNAIKIHGGGAEIKVKRKDCWK